MSNKPGLAELVRNNFVFDRQGRLRGIRFNAPNSFLTSHYVYVDDPTDVNGQRIVISPNSIISGNNTIQLNQNNTLTLNTADAQRVWADNLGNDGSSVNLTDDMEVSDRRLFDAYGNEILLDSSGIGLAMGSGNSVDVRDSADNSVMQVDETNKRVDMRNNDILDVRNLRVNDINNDGSDVLLSDNVDMQGNDLNNVGNLNSASGSGKLGSNKFGGSGTTSFSINNTKHSLFQLLINVRGDGNTLRIVDNNVANDWYYIRRYDDIANDFREEAKNTAVAELPLANLLAESSGSRYNSIMVNIDKRSGVYPSVWWQGYTTHSDSNAGTRGGRLHGSGYITNVDALNDFTVELVGATGTNTVLFGYLYEYNKP